MSQQLLDLYCDYLILTDVWFAAAETMRLVKTTVEKDFIVPGSRWAKRNRKVV